MFLVETAPADDAAIQTDMLAVLRSQDPAERKALIERITADPAYDRDRVQGWLHALELFEPLGAGQRRLDVPIDAGVKRLVRLRIPKGYDPRKPWPLIVAYHGGGDKASRFIRTVEGLLGERVESFIIAAPHDYRHTVIDLPGPPSAEHPAVWRAVKHTVHIDSDRVYVIGHSLGGYAAWTSAILHADQFAAAMPLGCAYSIPSEGRLWTLFFANFKHVPIYHVWGELDGLNVPRFGGRHSFDTITGLNVRFAKLAKEASLDVTSHSISGVAHNGAIPPPELLSRWLEHRRIRRPSTVDHTFRHLYQGSAYWIEGHSWTGDGWDDAFHSKALDELNALHGAADPAPVIDSIEQRLGHLRGNIDGQVISVERTHIGEFTLWLSEGMVDWQKPVALIVDGVKVWDERVHPDLNVCLRQAARTFDFDRLRWAGLRVDESGTTTVVNDETRFPPSTPDAGR